MFGKGMYLWQIEACEDGNPSQIASVAEEAGLKHVLIKIADAGYAYNIVDGVDKVQPVIDALHEKNISVWGWHYVYGYNPIAEANIAIQQYNSLSLDGYVIDAEMQYKNRHTQANTFMERIKNEIKIPIALSSFRFPSYHRDFPWQEFLSRVDYNMPQVYWLLATNAGAQLRRSVDEFNSGEYPTVPIVPTGDAYLDNVYNWKPTPDQVKEFMETANELKLDGFNFWEWANARRWATELWDEIAAFENDYEPPVVIPEEPKTKLVQLGKVTNFYGLNVRSSPSTGSRVWFLMSNNTEFEILEERKIGTDIWWRIGQTQWCAHKYNNKEYSIILTI